MAKGLLKNYRIGGDIIDRVSTTEPSFSPEQNTVGHSPAVSPLGDAAIAHSDECAVAQGEPLFQAIEAVNSVADTPPEPQGATPTTETPEQTGTIAPLHQPQEPEETETFESAPRGDAEPEAEPTAEETPGDGAAQEAAGDQAAAEPALAHSAECAVAQGEPEPAAADFTATKDGLFHIFVIDGVLYRVGGVKPLFVTSLRVNIRAVSEDRSYYDSLDLYSAKGRNVYASALNRQWGMRPWQVERDLVRILEHLEHERDEQLKAGNKKPVIEITPEDRQLGLDLLRDPDLFTRIVDDLSALGYVGEDLNKQLLYLCASSRKLDDPISVLILSQSASGKSFLVDSVKKLMPGEDVVAVTSLSDQALNYIEDLLHKFLVLGEAVHGEAVEHQIREMLSGKELSRMVPIKDPETGKFQSQVVRTPVVVASVMSGTNHRINPENASRCFIINTDESRDQTARIHEHQRHKYSLGRITTGQGDTQRIVRAHRAAQRLLEKRTIVNTFAPLLDFPTSLMRLRRDHDRFLDLIACVCFLRQYQKPIKTNGATAYIECDLEDYAIAYRIMVEGVLASTMRELPKGAHMLYEEVRKIARQEATLHKLKVTEVSVTQRQLREVCGFGQTWVREQLRMLVDYEYLVVSRGGQERSKGFFHLRDDADLAAVDLSMIPTPEVMRTLMTGKQP